MFNSVYYKRVIPVKAKGNVQLQYSNMAAGKYLLSIVKVGYQSNDLYGPYIQSGSPTPITKNQVQALKEINSGTPKINEIVEKRSTL